MTRPRGPPVLLGFLLCLVAACGGEGGVAWQAGTESPSTLEVVHDEVPGALRGTPYEISLATAGGAGSTRSWRLVRGSMPPGLGLLCAGDCPEWDPFVETGTVDASVPGGVLREVSGLAISRLNPGVRWVHDDSGSPSNLYALDAVGSLRQQYRVDVPAVDWEDIALGPGPDPDQEYLYVGDVGDNGAARTDARLLRIEEPIVPALPGETIELACEAFYFVYPDGPRDCETLLVDWATGTPYLVEKSDSGGDAFRFPLPLDPGWSADAPVTVIAVTSGRPLPASLTAGDATRDGRRIALRSYATVGYEFILPPGGGFEDLFDLTVCSFLFTRFQQYEALAYDPSGTTLTTTTEIPSFFATAPIRTAGAAFVGPELSLAGTPTATGSYTFTVEVRDEAGQTAEETLTIEVE